MPVGEEHGSAKLDEYTVRYCRSLVAKGWATCSLLAPIFKVAETTMLLAVTGETWKHIGYAVEPVGPGKYSGGGRPRKAKYHMTCAQCGKKFKGKTPGRKFCQPKCRAAAFYWTFKDETGVTYHRRDELG